MKAIRVSSFGGPAPTRHPGGRAIRLARASLAQSVAMLLTLAVWVVGVTETFRATHLVPSVHLYLLFWSCVIANLAALPVGILLGYRRG